MIIDYIEVEKWGGERGEVGNVRDSIERSSSLLTGFGPVDNTRIQKRSQVPHFHVFSRFLVGFFNFPSKINA